MWTLLVSWAVRLVGASREPARVGLPELQKYLTYGASPRATIGMIEGARALAMMRGRRYALPEDVADLAHDVMRHRLVLSYEALAEGRSADDLIDALLASAAPAARALAPGEAAAPAA
jgi:MoxR-like ATPase